MFRILGALLILTAAGTAVAQDSSGTGVDADRDTASPEQMRAAGEDATAKVREHVKVVKKLTADAQSKSDAQLLGCLVPKVTSLEALQGSIETAASSMNAALADPSTVGLARSKYALIAASSNRAFSIRQAAEACDTGSSYSDRRVLIDVTTGVGDEGDTVDRDELDGLDVGIDVVVPPPTMFVP